MTPDRRKGTLRKYLYYGSQSKIPLRTKRFWKQKLQRITQEDVNFVTKQRFKNKLPSNADFENNSVRTAAGNSYSSSQTQITDNRRNRYSYQSDQHLNVIDEDTSITNNLHSDTSESSSQTSGADSSEDRYFYESDQQSSDNEDRAEDEIVVPNDSLPSNEDDLNNSLESIRDSDSQTSVTNSSEDRYGDEDQDLNNVLSLNGDDLNNSRNFIHDDADSNSQTSVIGSLEERNLDQSDQQSSENEDRHEDVVPALNNVLREEYYGFTSEQLQNFVLINSLKVNHGLTFSAVQDITTLINIITESSSLNKSKYNFNRILDSFASYITVHHVCDECGIYLGKEPEIENKLHCDKCEKDIDVRKNKESGNFFLYISISAQLQKIFSKYGDSILNVLNRIKRNHYAIEEIYDGNLYKKNQTDDMISLTFSYDGVPIFKSSTFSLHPILCTINEVSPEFRRNNILLCSLWFGRKKPVVNTYFIPFVNECQQLSEKGFNYIFDGQEYKKKCKVLLGVCDSVARCDVRNSKQFNGIYGCGLCDHPGVSVPKGDGYTRVYPIDENDNPYGEGLRNHEQALTYNVQEQKGLPPDWMHCVALGVCRQFANLWFERVNHHEDFYFHKHLPVIDSLLLSFKPPLEISRTPRQMTERSHWKAHEWTVWLLCYSVPILMQVFSMKYVQHWALLVESISILLKDSLMGSEIAYAENSLLRFVKEVPELYNISCVSFNVHLLTHLAQSVRDWGPLWSHSAFIFEDYNQDLIKTVKSSQHVILQVSTAFRLKNVVKDLYNLCYNDFTEKQRIFIENLLFPKKYSQKTVSIDNVQVIGEPNSRKLSRSEFLAFRRNNINCIANTEVSFYHRILHNKEVIHSKKYTKIKKRNSYTVLLKSKEFFEIETFVVIKGINGKSVCYALGRYFDQQKSPLLANKKFLHTVLHSKDDDLSVIIANEILQKVIIMHFSRKYFAIACERPNRNEYLV